MAEKLIPPDYSRCQAERKVYLPFIMGGNVNQWVRCDIKPRWLAEEKKPGPDGVKGSMTLCDNCKKQMKKKYGKEGLALPKITPINREGTTHGRTRKAAR